MVMWVSKYGYAVGVQVTFDCTNNQVKQAHLV